MAVGGRTHRLQWGDLPCEMRAGLEELLGSTVVDAISADGGYSPSLASACTLADGRRVFVKAVSAAQNEQSLSVLRRERRLNESLPAGTPAPALIGAYDDGTWAALFFELVPGRTPGHPWTASDLARVVETSEALSALAPTDGLEPAGVTWDSGWRSLHAAETEPAGVSAAEVERFALLEVDAPAAVTGEHLVHGDLRSDNIVLSESGRVVFVDWTAVSLGAHWFDLMAMAPSVELEGGCSASTFIALTSDPPSQDQLLPAVAGLAGYLAWRGCQPDPPGLPTVRAFQRAQAAVTVRWLRDLLAGRASV